MNQRLGHLQEWLHGCITQSRQAHDECALYNTVASNKGLSRQARLAVYQRGYILRLRECLKAEYPLLIKAFSRDWFDLMAEHYLRSNPSTSSNLNELSARFPEFLKQDRPDRDAETKERAYDFMIALAEFERAKLEVGRLRGSEECRLNGLFDVETRNLMRLTVRVAQNVRLLQVPVDLVAYLDNNLALNSALLQSPGQRVLLSRKDYRVIYKPLTHWQYDLISTLIHNGELKAAIAVVSTNHPDIAVRELSPLFLSYMTFCGVFMEVNLGNERKLKVT